MNVNYPRKSYSRCEFGFVEVSHTHETERISQPQDLQVSQSKARRKVDHRHNIDDEPKLLVREKRVEQDEKHGRGQQRGQALPFEEIANSSEGNGSKQCSGQGGVKIPQEGRSLKGFGQG